MNRKMYFSITNKIARCHGIKNCDYEKRQRRHEKAHGVFYIFN